MPYKFMLFLIYIINIVAVKVMKAGTVPIFGNDKVVFVSSLKHPGRLVLPKGKIKNWEGPVDAARRETEEECGAVGDIEFDVAYHNDATVYFLMYVKEMNKIFDDMEARDVKLLSFDEVEDSLRIKSPIKRIIRDVKEIVRARNGLKFSLF